jgi:hypothetical protein
MSSTRTEEEIPRPEATPSRTSAGLHPTLASVLPGRCRFRASGPRGIAPGGRDLILAGAAERITQLNIARRNPSKLVPDDSCETPVEADPVGFQDVKGLKK